MVIRAGLWLLFVGSLVPNLSYAARYRIDPQPREAVSVETYIERPWTMLASLPMRASEVLTLLNFVVDRDADQVEGRDYPEYDRRGQFGTWQTLNPEKNCYNTRAEILIRDSLVPVKFSRRNPCTVEKGKWHDSYTGEDFTEAADIQIDHIVPLKNAYDSGAWKWDRAQRCHYANFTAYGSHLLPVSAHENMKKGDSSPAQYMPPDPKDACQYLLHWLNVKAVWNLTLEEDEAQSIHALMEQHKCGARYQSISQATLNRQMGWASHPVDVCL